MSAGVNLSDQRLMGVANEIVAFSSPIVTITPSQYSWHNDLSAYPQPAELANPGSRQDLRGRFAHTHKGRQLLKRGNPYRRQK